MMDINVFVCKCGHGWSEKMGEVCPECGHKFIKKYKRIFGFIEDQTKFIKKIVRK
jgi:hypothetical protein